MNKGAKPLFGLSAFRPSNFKARLLLLIILIIPIALSAETDSLYLVAQRQFQHKHFDSAVVSFTQLIQKYPDKREGYYNRGLALYNIKKYPDAISDFEQCLKIDSGFTEAQFMASKTLEKKGELKGAITELERIKAKNNDYDQVEKRIKNYQLSVYISENWYYMLAMMLLFIVLVAVAAKAFSSKRG